MAGGEAGVPSNRLSMRRRKITRWMSFTDYSQVDIVGLQYESVNFEVKKGLGGVCHDGEEALLQGVTHHSANQ